MGRKLDSEAAVRSHSRHCRAKALSPATISARENILRRLAKFTDPVPLTEVKLEDLERWRDSLTVKTDTAAGYISHIKAFYGWAASTGLMPLNPAAALPKPRVSRRLPRPIAEEDLAYALDCAPRRIRPWLVLAAWCGLRAKEIALLRGENILLRAKPPVLLIASDATKGRSERTIPLSTYAVAELAKSDLPLTGLCFRRVDGSNLPLRPWLISKICNRHLHDCGISSTLHALRHRFLSQVYANGHDLRVTQELAGHASPVTTAVYAAWDRAGAAAAVEAIPSPYGNPAA